MAYLEPDLAAVRSRRTDVVAPSDLVAFWQATIAESRATSVEPIFTPAPSPLRVIDTFDLTFPGYAGQPIRGWLHLPAGTRRRLPCVVEYIGYGGGRGLAHQTTLWAAAGFAHLVMDTRGQGSAWTVGESADPHEGAAAFPGVMTRGILDPRTYYYRRLYTDAVRAVDAARTHPLVDPERVAVAGISQGGGVAIAASALAQDVAAVLPEVPFLCDIRRAVTLTDEAPYREITDYLAVHRDQAAQVQETLRYVDGAVLAGLASAPALFSVALMDATCPPSTVYAAYNAYAGSKRIVEYEFNDHEGGGAFHEVTKIAWLRELLDPAG